MTGAASKKYKIIIVENDDDERLFMKEGFEQSGHFEILALLKNGDMLMNWLSEHSGRPDLVLSDLNMPGKNGYDIIGLMKDFAGGQIPVIITSTSTTVSIIDRCLNEGAADYLVKPDTFIEYNTFADRLYDLIQNKIKI